MSHDTEKEQSVSFPELSTDRLILRQVKGDDDNEIFRLRSDEKVNMFLDRPGAETIVDAQKFIHKINEGISKNEWLYWAITLKNSNKLIGTICLWNLSVKHSKAEIGFELLPEYQGLGIMREALAKIIEYGFENKSLHLIEGEVDPENKKSVKLLKKFGFVYTRKSKNTVIYSLFSRDE
ncbi:MAG: GNAT family N-acetyltransferase [Calditrichaceae bacterium]